jgi:hypothetical protein
MSPRQLCLDLNPLKQLHCSPMHPILCLMPDSFTRQCNRLNTQVTNLVLYYAVELNMVNDKPRSDLSALHGERHLRIKIFNTSLDLIYSITCRILFVYPITYSCVYIF